jgi:GTP cyclohydrolase II
MRNKNFSDALDVDNVELKIEKSLAVISDYNNKDNEFKEDYEKSRENLYQLLDTGKDAVEGILEVAKETDHPRAYEVVGQLLKTVTDTNIQLLEIQQKRIDIENAEVKQGDTNIQNALFIGSTADLQKLMKERDE